MSLVLDGSATLAWLYPDETTPPIESVFDQLLLDGAVVPPLWHIEIANSLTIASRRGRITTKDRRDSLADLDALPIYTDDRTTTHVWKETLDLADKYGLTIYDATYLELAVRHKLSLATLDDDLRRAASAEGVRLLGL